MLKKVLISLLVAIIASTCLSLPVFAQFSVDAMAIETAFKNEPPLTQADIDKFIKIAPDMIAAATANDTVKAGELLGNAGWSEVRGSYVTAKISNAYAIIMSPEMAKSMLQSAGMPEILFPTDAETDLVKRNLNELNAVFGSAGLGNM